MSLKSCTSPEEVMSMPSHVSKTILRISGANSVRGREEKSMLENGTSRGVTFEAQDELLFKIWAKEELRTKQSEDPHIKPLIERNISGRPGVGCIKK